jgi:hypothetical protein
MGYWEIVLLSDDCAVKIYEDRGCIDIVLGTVKLEDWVDLGIVVFYITKGQEFIGAFPGDFRERDEQLIRLANILEKHLEQISAIFKDFKRHKPELLAIRDTVMDLYMIRFSNRDDLLKYVPKRK